MTRLSRSTLSACLTLLVTAFGCNDGGGAPGTGGGGQGGVAAGGTTGTGKGGATGAAGATGVAGANGAAGASSAAGASGTAGKGAAGATGAAGTTGAAGKGAAGATGTAGAAGKGAAGATGTAGATGAAGTGGTLVCQANETCPTLGQECQTDCTTGANSHSTFCTCADQGGGQPSLACVSLSCGRDAAVTDAGTIFPACTAGLRDGDDCTPGTDTICQSACTAGKQMHCLCAPHGGGGGGKWACTTGITCQ